MENSSCFSLLTDLKNINVQLMSVETTINLGSFLVWELISGGQNSNCFQSYWWIFFSPILTSGLESPESRATEKLVCLSKINKNCQPGRDDGTIGLFMQFWKSEKWPAEWKPKQKVLPCVEYINMWLQTKKLTDTYKLKKTAVAALRNIFQKFNSIWDKFAITFLVQRHIFI